MLRRLIMTAPSVLTRNIGADNVAAVGYGAMSLGVSSYGGPPEGDEERFKVLDRLLEIGSTNWDTARVYGDSEDLIGKWFARTGKRDKIFLATKFGFTPDRKVRGDPELIRQQLATSLEKLQTDHIDLYYSHRTDKNTPIEETIECLAELVKEGKIRYIGLSEASPNTIRRAHKIHPIAAIQVEYSPWELALERPGGVIETARELGITIVAYSPTGRGLATGRFRSVDDFAADDFRRSIPKYAAKNFPHILKLVDGLQAFGKKYDATAAQVAIAWLLAQGNDIIPIPGSRRIKYCEENAQSAAVFNKLSGEDVKEIRVLCEEAEKNLSGGDRYSAMAMEMLYVDTPPYKG